MNRISIYIISFVIIASAYLTAQDSEALKLLKDGNNRFVNGKLLFKDFKGDRTKLTNSQSPYAIVVTCSDSRVPAEYIFDESLGKLFVIRNAGNVLDKIELGSIEYAATQLNSKTLIIMGHKSCGAVKAKLAATKLPSKNLNAIVDKIILPKDSDKLHQSTDLDEAIKFNVNNQIDYLKKNSQILNKLIISKQLEIVGAIYDIESGKVEFINE